MPSRADPAQRPGALRLAFAPGTERHPSGGGDDGTRVIEVEAR
jgi:hypothetical protein